jgi:predicted transcriptional regulator
MSTVYNPEADVIAEIERLELEAREMRRKLKYVRGEEDKRVLNRLLKEVEERVTLLRKRVP